ncbi:diguanylate cyclase (GGDEF)-like protein [Natronospira proteinivora]|uniref:diguanylate cyclase n=1 Tax=Natronospira proteinivora TaxID=1807133 RepID=A0ABT1G8W9_9GAMM|nr:tetratricopeptide repeat-containing diguanylate cyclase [Natronospira proteinivora]MCP1727757.1 diguanylate cyclase (GGDEF)-like protein [Natronospira proteinivora]
MNASVLPMTLLWLCLLLVLPYQSHASQVAEPVSALLTDAGEESDSNAALPLLEEALALARSLENPAGEAQALLQIANIQRDQGRREAALMTLSAVKALALRSGDERLHAEAEHVRATVYLDAGDFEEALRLNQAVLRLAEGIEDQVLLAAANNTAGNLHFSLGDSEQARRYYYRALEGYEALEDQGRYGIMLGNIGNTFNDDGDYESALPYHQRSLALMQELDRPTSAAYQQVNICNTLISMESLERAVEYCRQGIETLEGSGHFRALHYAYNRLADLYLKLDQPEQVEALYIAALELSRELEARPQLVDSHRALSEFYESVGDYARALVHARDHFSVHSELMDAQRQEAILEAEEAFQAEQRQQRIEHLELDAELREMTLRNRQILSIVGFALFLLASLVAVLAWRAYRIRRVSGERIEKKNQELSRALDMIQQLARQDPLTGLANRRHILEVVKAEQSRGKRSEKPITLALYDIDHFKLLNDTHGHHVGDQVLVALSKRVQSQLRASDCLCRWGGEEFLLLMPETDLEQAGVVTEKIREIVEAEPFDTDAGPLSVRITIGVAQLSGSDLTEAVRHADHAMYEGKAKGRNRVVMKGQGG